MDGLRLALALGVLLVPAPAFAHPDIDEGRRLAQSAELERAMEAFDRAEASGELSREDRIALHEGRALVYHALGNDAALSRTLAALVELAPRHEMGRDIPPALRERFDALRRSAAPTAEAPGEVRAGGSLEPRITTHDAPSDEGAAPRTPAPAGAEPIRTAPSPAEVAGEASATSATAPHVAIGDADEPDGLGPWPLVGAAAIVLAAGAAVAIYFLVPGSSTQPSYPRHPL